MALPHDAPTMTQLIESVREWLESDVMAATDGRLRFHARVAVNILAMVERELDLGAEQHAAHRRRLDALGMSSDRELAEAIRSGALDDRLGEVREFVRASVVDKVNVANPGYLVGRDRRAEP